MTVDVFISYSQADRERVQSIVESLRALQLETWFDERLAPGGSFGAHIDEVVRSCKVQLVLWSPTAVRSDWVRAEADIGRERGILVAASLQPCSIPVPFNIIQSEDLSNWSGTQDHRGWRKVLEEIGRRVARPGLGDLARLQASASTDATTWKRWAQQNPDDPLVEEVWRTVEELEMTTLRERLQRERQAPPVRQTPARRPAPPAPQATRVTQLEEEPTYPSDSRPSVARALTTLAIFSVTCFLVLFTDWLRALTTNEGLLALVFTRLFRWSDEFPLGHDFLGVALLLTGCTISALLFATIFGMLWRGPGILRWSTFASAGALGVWAIAYILRGMGVLASTGPLLLPALSLSVEGIGAALILFPGERRRWGRVVEAVFVAFATSMLWLASLRIWFHVDSDARGWGLIGEAGREPGAFVFCFVLFLGILSRAPIVLWATRVPIEPRWLRVILGT